MQPLIMVVHVIACVSIVVLVLIQHGKGADAGAAFGSGASNTVFGSQGSTSFLFKMTAGLAAIFFITSITLSYIASNRPNEVTAFELIQGEVKKVEQQHEQKTNDATAVRERGIPASSAIPTSSAP